MGAVASELCLALFCEACDGARTGGFQPEIKGALAAVGAEKFSLDKFHKNARVELRFMNEFAIAVDSCVSTTPASLPGTDAGDQAASAGGTMASPSADLSSSKTAGQSEANGMPQVAAFRMLCEAHCRREIEARVVCLVSQGTHVELQKTVTSSRLYENLTAAAPCMAVYDVKMPSYAGSSTTKTTFSPKSPC